MNKSGEIAKNTTPEIYPIGFECGPLSLALISQSIWTIILEQNKDGVFKMKTFLFALTLMCATSHCIANDLESIIRNLEGELGTAKFEAVGNPGFLTIEGDKGSITGKYSKAGGKLTGSFDIDLNSLSTDMELRDEHMKTKYLETKKYPKATLTVENVVLPKDGYFKFAGKLSLHGKTNAASGDCLLKEAVNFECKFKIALTDYGIAIPEWKGVTVAKDVNIVVRVALK